MRHQLKGSNRFSTLDMVHSFHQFELEEKARKLFTFRAPGGLYRYKRMVMGNNPSSSESHRRVKTVVTGCEGVIQIKDDIVVHGKDEVHDERLRIVLSKLKEAGLTLLGRKNVSWEGPGLNGLEWSFQNMVWQRIQTRSKSLQISQHQRQ